MLAAFSADYVIKDEFFGIDSDGYSRHTYSPA
jgi:hypothetical protein